MNPDRARSAVELATRPMDAAELRGLGDAYYRDAPGLRRPGWWQTRLASEVAVSPRTVRRYLSGAGSIPGSMAALFRVYLTPTVCPEKRVRPEFTSV